VVEINNINPVSVVILKQDLYLYQQIIQWIKKESIMIQKTIIPTNTNVTLSLKVPENFVGEEIEIIAYIKNKELPIESTGLLSPSIKGNPMSNAEFKNWIKQAESMPVVSIDEVEKKWTRKRKQLEMLIK
jgi:hypothetical protein